MSRSSRGGGGGGYKPPSGGRTMGSAGSRSGGGRASLGNQGRSRSMGSGPTGSPRPSASPRIPAPRPMGGGNSNRQRNSGPSFGSMVAANVVANQISGGNRGMHRGRGPRRGGRHHFHSQPRMRHHHHGGHHRGRSGGRFQLFFVILMLVMAIFIFSEMGGGGTTAHNIEANVVERTPLASNVANQNAPGIIDRINFLTNQNQVNNALRNFHNETGIWITVYITDNLDGQYHNHVEVASYIDPWMQNFFDTHLVSGGNMLLVIYDDGTDWDVFMQIGNQAGLVMDRDAEIVLIAHLENHWFSDTSEDQVIIRTLNDTARHIMHVPRPLWFTLLMASIPLGIALIAILAYRMRNQRKQQKEAHDERVLQEASQVDLDIQDNALNSVMNKYEED